MDNNNNEVKSNLLRLPENTHLPVSYLISIHINNLFSTYGEEYVRFVFKDLFETNHVDSILRKVHGD